MQVTVAAACVRVRPRAGRVVAFVSGPVLRPRYLLYLLCSRFFFSWRRVVLMKGFGISPRRMWSRSWRWWLFQAEATLRAVSGV